MKSILHPIKEVYNWKGYFITIFYFSVPGISLMIARITDAIFPMEEFYKFLRAALIMTLAIFLHTSWENYKVYRLRKSKKIFKSRAKCTLGTIVKVEKVFLNNKFKEVSIQGHRCWKIQVKYYNDYIGQEDLVYSDYYKVNPLRYNSQKEIEVYYEKFHVVVGDFYKI